MMKTKLLSVLFFSFIFLISCSGDDDSGGGGDFSINGTSYNLIPENGIVITNSSFGGSTVDITRSTVSIVGLTANAMNSGSVTFDLYYQDGEGISGSYDITDATDPNDLFITDFVEANVRGCSGWSSVSQQVDLETTEQSFANNPVGTVDLTDNGNNNYTVRFNGSDFRTYDSDFNVSGTVEVNLNVRSNARIENF